MNGLLNYSELSHSLRKHEPENMASVAHITGQQDCSWTYRKGNTASTEPSDHVRLSSSQRTASKGKGTRDQNIHPNLALCLGVKEFSPFSCEWKYFFMNSPQPQ